MKSCEIPKPRVPWPVWMHTPWHPLLIPPHTTRSPSGCCAVFGGPAAQGTVRDIMQCRSAWAAVTVHAPGRRAPARAVAPATFITEILIFLFDVKHYGCMRFVFSLPCPLEVGPVSAVHGKCGGRGSACWRRRACRSVRRAPSAVARSPPHCRRPPCTAHPRGGAAHRGRVQFFEAKNISVKIIIIIQQSIKIIKIIHNRNNQNY